MFDPNQRPDTRLCPEKYCFHWAEAGDRVDCTGRTYKSFQAAIAAAKTVIETAGCACVFGKCVRNTANRGTSDLYEPAERVLKNSGLPWFYFVSKDSLAAEFWDEFDRESRALWGDDSVK